MNDTMLNVRETARRLGVSEATVRNWANAGTLRPIRLPGSGFRRFEAAEVEALCEVLERRHAGTASWVDRLA